MPQRRSRVPADRERLPGQLRSAKPQQSSPQESAPIVGNQAIGRLLSAAGAQAKLEISQPGDPLEQEADRIARDVMATMPSSPSSSATPEPTASGSLARQTIEEEELLAKGDSSAEGGVSPPTTGKVAAASGGGKALPTGLQGAMGRRLGADLGSVRTHTDAEADMLSRGVHARAFTTGNHVFFRSGEYDPSSARGQELIAHELTHVVQQAGPGVVQRNIVEKSEDDWLEEMTEKAEEQKRLRQQDLERRHDQRRMKKAPMVPGIPDAPPLPEPEAVPEDAAPPQAQEAAAEEPTPGIMEAIMKPFSWIRGLFNH